MKLKEFQLLQSSIDHLFLANKHLPLIMENIQFKLNILDLPYLVLEME